MTQYERLRTFKGFGWEDSIVREVLILLMDNQGLSPTPYKFPGAPTKNVLKHSARNDP